MLFVKRDIDLVMEILGLSNFAAKEKTTQIQLSRVEMDMHRIDIPRTIK